MSRRCFDPPRGTNVATQLFHWIRFRPRPGASQVLSQHPSHDRSPQRHSYGRTDVTYRRAIAITSSCDDLFSHACLYVQHAGCIHVLVFGWHLSPITLPYAFIWRIRKVGSFVKEGTNMRRHRIVGELASKGSWSVSPYALCISMQ
jgi:hypothetical protein